MRIPFLGNWSKRHALTFTLFCVLLAPADPSFSDDSESFSQSTLDDRRTMRKFPANIGRGITGLFDRENFLPAFWSLSVITVSWIIEDDVRDKIVDEEDEASEFASDHLGPAGLLGVVTAGVFIAGQKSDDMEFRDMSYDMGVAVVTNLLLTGVIKVGTGRTRPNESNDDSFPSGHTSNAFAIASVLDAYYGSKAGVPAYAVASPIGLSRVRRDVHWLSDVVAGARPGFAS